MLIKPNLGYQRPHPATTRLELLLQIVGKVAELAPNAKVAIIEGVTFAGTAEDSFRWHGLNRAPWPIPVDLLDADHVERSAYVNPAPVLPRFSTIEAPAILAEADICLSVAPLKRTILNGQSLISGTGKNLYGLLPREVYKARSPNSRGMLHRPSVFRVIPEVLRTLAPFFTAGLLDLHSWFDGPDWHPDRGVARHLGKIIWGLDFDAIDRLGCETVGIGPDARLAMPDGHPST